MEDSELDEELINSNKLYMKDVLGREDIITEDIAIYVAAL